MTQKQAIKTMLETAFELPHFRLVFISKWLEDINWHSENRMLYNKVAKPYQDFMDDAERYEFGTNPGDMNYEDGSKTIWLCRRYGLRFERAMLNYEIKKTNFYAAINMLYGWGLDNSWDSTTGEKFVDELIEMVFTKQK